MRPALRDRWPAIAGVLLVLVWLARLLALAGVAIVATWAWRRRRRRRDAPRPAVR